MDEFLAEIPADLYLEWQAFDDMESLNPAGVILQGLAGKKGGKTSWQEQKAKMLQHAAIVEGKKHGRD